MQPFRVVAYSADASPPGWSLLATFRREPDALAHAHGVAREYQMVAAVLVRDGEHNDPAFAVLYANVPNPSGLLKVPEFRTAAEGKGESS